MAYFWKIEDRIFIFLGICLSFLGWVSSSSLAMPQTVVLIRHAEKPDDRDDIHLSEKGYERARALSHFFFTISPPEKIRLIAQGQKRPDSSLRPIETLIPTAHLLNQTIHHSFVKGESKAMVDFLKKEPEWNGQTVVISWGHDELGAISAMLGVRQGEWSSALFDRAWVFQLNADGTLNRFEDIPQRLLPGDSRFVCQF